MNIFLNEYFEFCLELNFELNHFLARFNEKMNFQNVSNRATLWLSLVVYSCHLFDIRQEEHGPNEPVVI